MDPWYIEKNRAISRARAARERLGVPPDGRVDDLLATVEADALPVVVADLGAGVDGAYVPSGPTVFVHGERPLVRQRFTLAHEYGHHVLGHRRSVDAPGYLASAQLEEQCANTFAAELLITRAAARAWGARHPQALRRCTLEDVVGMAAHFGVSASAALIRLQTAGLAPDAARCAALHAEIAEHLHLPLYVALGLAELEDGLAAAARSLPRIPAAFAGSAGARELLR